MAPDQNSTDSSVHSNNKNNHHAKGSTKKPQITRAKTTKNTKIIPKYLEGENQDDVNITYKAMKYLFRRCKIEESSGFSNEASLGGGVGVAGAGGSDKYRRQQLKQQYQLHQQQLYKEMKQHISSTTSSTSSSSPHFHKTGVGIGGDGVGSIQRPFTQMKIGTLPRVSNSIFLDHDEPLLNDEDEDLELSEEQLDILYNKSGFEAMVNNDKHRVLIDWKKNKFRASCILSKLPSIINPSEFKDDADGEDAEDLLVREERREAFLKRKLEIAPGYSFIVLPPTSSDLEYIKTLSESTLYTEHYVSLDTKKRLVTESLQALQQVHQRKVLNNKSGQKNNQSGVSKTMMLLSGTLGNNSSGFAKKPNSEFDLDDWSFIINTFLRKLAFEVQVDRLYRTLYRDRIKKLEEEKKRKQQRQNPLSIPEAAEVNNITSRRSKYIANPPTPKRIGYSNEENVNTNTPVTKRSVSSSSLNITPSNFLIASPSTGVSISPTANLKEEKYYIKKTRAPEIPFSHKQSNNTNSSSPISSERREGAPTISPIIFTQNIQTTKPRAISRSNSPVRVARPMSRATSHGNISSLASPSPTQSSFSSVPISPDHDDYLSSKFVTAQTPESIKHAPSSPSPQSHTSHIPTSTIRKRSSQKSLLSASNTPTLSPSRSVSSSQNLASVIPKGSRISGSKSAGNLYGSLVDNNDSSTQTIPTMRRPSSRATSISNAHPSPTVPSGSVINFSGTSNSSSSTALTTKKTSNALVAQEKQREEMLHDKIRKEVMITTRKAVEQRLERERLLIEAEKKLKKKSKN